MGVSTKMSTGVGWEAGPGTGFEFVVAKLAYKLANYGTYGITGWWFHGFKHYFP